MASLSFTSLQHNLPFFPTLLHTSPPIHTIRPQAINLTDKTPLTPQTHNSKPKNHTTQPSPPPVANERTSIRPPKGSTELGRSGSPTRSKAAELRAGLDTCSKTGDVLSAIALYDDAVMKGVNLEQYHYNVLLYLCASAAIGEIHPAKSGSTGDATETDINPILVTNDVRDYARERGFQIYKHMCEQKVEMGEAALTSVARMAMAVGDGDEAFKMVKLMKEMGIAPKLRSYGPAIFAFCENGEIEKAFEVERHMVECGVWPEEAELEALLRASVRARRGERVYYVLQRLRDRVRQVGVRTAEVIEEWFRSGTAARVGKRKWEREVVERAVERVGGGWHGLGWLGRGKWSVGRTQIDGEGFCLCCGEKLVTIDLDPVETEKLAKSVEAIASKRDKRSSFEKFQRWLDYYGPFEAVVDAANIGLFSQRRFSLIKVNSVVNGIRQKLPLKKWPLIIVHNRRLLGGKMDEPLNAKLIEKWKNADAIYATPTGSNDDWYWLYAAIKCKSLIVTNDEMRDHIFEILGNDFFPKWKERHQVHFSLSDGNFEFQMPPPYSIVIQESKEGNWHIPISIEYEPERERTWLCITRATRATIRATKQESPYPSTESPLEKKFVKSASGAESDSQIQPSSDVGCVQKIEHPHKIIRVQRSKASAGSSISSIKSNLEAAEKLSGCVIDFQI